MEIEEVLERFHSASLRLYPEEFQREFVPEMKGVFAEALADAHKDGYRAVLNLIMREIKHLPGSWLREHRRAWRDKEADMNTSANDQASGEMVARATTRGWGEALLAALPYLMFGIFEVLGSVLAEIGVISVENKGMQVLNYAGLVCLAGTLLVTLVVAWRRGWPLWSASWYLFYALPLLWPLIWLISQVFDPFSALGQISGFLMGMILIAGVLYTITRLDRLRGMLAALPILYLIWLPNLEQTPLHIIPFPIRIGVMAASAITVALGVIATVRIRDWRMGFWILLAAILVVGLQYSYVGIYHGGTLPNVAPGPSPVEVGRSFLPQYLAACSILLGPIFARMFRGIGRSSGTAGKVGYHLALLGLLAIILANLVSLWISIGDYFGDTGPVHAALASVITIGLAGYAVGLLVLYWSARRSDAWPDPVEGVLLAILPVAMPLTIILPALPATRPMIPLYGFPAVWALPDAVVLGTGLAWLLLSAWLVTRRRGMPALAAAIPQLG